MSRRKGLTLIEVVAGMAMLGGLLSGVLVAYGRHVRQVRRAELRLAAVGATDRLLAGWFGAADSAVPRRRDGRMPGDKRFHWWTHVLEDAKVQGAAGLEVVRLEVFEEPKTAGDKKDEPLVAVDLVVPEGDDPPEMETEAAKPTAGNNRR